MARELMIENLAMDLERFKEMEKDQIEDAWIDGMKSDSGHFGTEEQYYNNLVGSGFVVALRYTDKSQSPPFNINFVVLEYRQSERR
jgi:hypothetical protein